MQHATTLESSAIRRLERCGLASWPAWFARGETVDDLEPDLYLYRIQGCLAGVAPGVDVPIFNRVVGIGQLQPAYPSLIDWIVHLYKTAKVPSFSIQVTPTADPPSIGDWLKRRGFRRAAPWARLTRGVEPVAMADSRVSELEDKVAIVELRRPRLPYSTFGSVVQRALGYPDVTAPWFELFIGRRGWRHYVAIDRECGGAVGAAAWFRTGSLASIEIGAVVPWARGMGVHSALIARQIRDAAEEGCTQVTMETAVHLSDWRGQAYRNARRLGFDLAYFTTNWTHGRHRPGPKPAKIKRENQPQRAFMRDLEEFRKFWSDLGRSGPPRDG